MSMYRLKSVARRSTFFGAAVAVFAATVVPTAQVFAANALNPLTERSLLLSSSAPGFVDTDGSNYSTGAPNPAAGGTPGTPGYVPGTYAPAGSGPNGKKTGQTFTFRVSSGEDIRGISFQYCTTAAGMCQAPGNNTGDARTTRQANEGSDGGWANGTSDLNVTNEDDVFEQSEVLPPGAGEFQISVDGNKTSAEDWVMAATNAEDPLFSHPDNNRLTGKNNYITLSSANGQPINAGQRVKVEFTASEDSFITNPGAGSFFVKINTYSSATSLLGAHNDATPKDDPDYGDNHTVIDGGVTVANVMTDSIHITTKVLETMAFSVGVQNRDSRELSGGDRHGTCDAIQVINNNRLDLGNPAAENSLETGRAWDVNSYWRLSSNSSGGASVYYSGDTLHNTVGDAIRSIGTSATTSNPGTEQFGLAFYSDLTVQEETSSTFDNEVSTDPIAYSPPSLLPLVREAAYINGEGNIGEGVNGETINAQFAFDEDSITTPALIAQNDDRVLSCATAKMRYVGNIAADTPAGVYTTKINYLAAPKY